MQIHYFDIVVGSIVLLLGLKGIINGFFKELFGLIGIIGGIYVASRYGVQVGDILNGAVFHFDNQSAVTLTGFMVTLASFWIAMIFIGYGFKTMSSASGLGFIDKLFGFIVGSGKFFLIASVIFFALNNIKAIKTNLQPLMKESILYPILIQTGDIIMHIDPTQVSSDISKSIDNGADKIKDMADKEIGEKAKKMVDDVKKNMQTDK